MVRGGFPGAQMTYTPEAAPTESSLSAARSHHAPP